VAEQPAGVERGVLNGAHMRSTAKAARTIDSGHDHKPKFFSTWGPKFIALIGKLPATLASRSQSTESPAGEEWDSGERSKGVAVPWAACALVVVLRMFLVFSQLLRTSTAVEAGCPLRDDAF
jgi:hypothetical protein